MTFRDRPDRLSVLLCLAAALAVALLDLPTASAQAPGGAAGGAAGTSGVRTLTPEAPVGDRFALVIGNAAYTHAPPLANATNDAVDMAEALLRAGFTVTVGTDLSQESMEGELSDFASRARGADAAAVFYAGHGVQVDGENYLLPVDANITSSSQFRPRTTPLELVMRTLEETQATFKLVMLDACRDNPFAATRTLSAGLANPSLAPTGSFIAYATAPGRRASDNPGGRNGLFTSAILAEMERPGVEIGQLFKNVQSRVSRASGAAQQPWTATSYAGDFFFTAPDGTPGAPPGLASAPSRSSAPGGAPEVGASEVGASEVGPSEAAPMRTAALTPEVVAAAEQGAAAFHARAYAQALPLLRAAADGGDAPSQTRLAVLYQRGWAVREDAREAVRLYRLAAAAGDAVAEGNLGYLYQHGLGVPANAGEAARLYRRAAAQGRASAQNNLGTLHQTGEGVARDDAEAARLYRLASEDGLAEATANLAFLTEYGRGVPADCAHALALYTSAGAAGHTAAAARARALTCAPAAPGAGPGP